MVYVITFLAYGLLGWYFWQTTWKNNRTLPDARLKLLIVIPLTLHAVLLYQSIFLNGAVNFNLANAISSILWLTGVIYWVGSFGNNFLGLQAIVLPIAGIGAMLPAFATPAHTLPYTSLPAFKLHFFIAILAYSLFTIAAFHALVMTLVERRLHGVSMEKMPNLPPLLTMEKLLFRIIALAFILLTLTLVSGILFSEALFQKVMPINHKTVFAVISWFLFAALLGGRAIYGWRGRIALRWILMGFTMLLLAYIGSKFVLELVLHRPALIS